MGIKTHPALSSVHSFEDYKKLVVGYIARYCVIAGAFESEPKNIESVYSEFRKERTAYLHNLQSDTYVSAQNYNATLNMYAKIADKFEYNGVRCGQFVNGSMSLIQSVSPPLLHGAF
jgi:hypothetical protein